MKDCKAGSQRKHVSLFFYLTCKQLISGICKQASSRGWVCWYNGGCVTVVMQSVLHSGPSVLCTVAEQSSPCIILPQLPSHLCVLFWVLRPTSCFLWRMTFGRLELLCPLATESEVPAVDTPRWGVDISDP